MLAPAELNKHFEIDLFKGPTTGKIKTVLDRATTASIAVIGDFCLDAYWTVDASAAEISVETGLPTRPVRQQKYSPGGAGNVVMNLTALDVATVIPIGVLGDDLFGTEFFRLMDHPRICRDHLLRQAKGWQTQTYIKPHIDQVEVERIDFGNFNALEEATTRCLLERIASVVARVPVVIINHQTAGSMHNCEFFRRGLASLIEENPAVRFIVDSRGYHEAYPKAFHKMNSAEVMKAAGKPLPAGASVSLDELLPPAKSLSLRWGAPLIVTRGENGCIVVDGEDARQIYGVQLLGSVDPVGAGDTFVAALAAGLAAGEDMVASAYLANLAASVTAQKLFQTGTASPREVLDAAHQADFVYRPELARSAANAAFFRDSEIEVIEDLPGGVIFRHVVFDHDGTISTLREGWEQIMEPMMTRAILGPRAIDADEALLSCAQSRVNDFINKTTGVQSIEQMHALRNMVLEFGCVPEGDVLSPEEYKQLYLAELSHLVDRRLAKLERGEVDIADYTVKGAVDFLVMLRRAGVTLYLASGTDDADLHAEAKRLGYAELFNGGIYGSHGEVGKDAKRVVMERILAEIDGECNRLLAFGDGPVEMREAVKRGGWAIGVASDEVRRFGLNLQKRERLVRAGACLVIPDYSQRGTLCRYLGLQAVS